MKSIFKIIILTSFFQFTKGRPVIFISYKQDSNELRSIISKLNKKFPRGFVQESQRKRPCARANKESLIHLCFYKKNDFNVLWQNTDLLKVTMSMFNKE